ncbi:uncharacterized protein SPSK_04755 [Sporothrix schenckii 1099-18]|uniref:Uncharacterized protein n=1 Tax=Sporothrix schenckii 1099-18 TaxID=1397361 RepID=A0A0F2M1B4_SPOSC|nr:uncharacterized protein SPSK_04755 [Sporothrix schenckii 1099-18]KJR82899.1 hypothetical protein SPSK_04755 [Sporothrix schenckii 1099-18]
MDPYTEYDSDTQARHQVRPSRKGTTEAVATLPATLFSGPFWRQWEVVGKVESGSVKNDRHGSWHGMFMYPWL